jgi:hypothetical protein
MFIPPVCRSSCFMRAALVTLAGLACSKFCGRLVEWFIGVLASAAVALILSMKSDPGEGPLSSQEHPPGRAQANPPRGGDVLIGGGRLRGKNRTPIVQK